MLIYLCSKYSIYIVLEFYDKINSFRNTNTLLTFNTLYWYINIIHLCNEKENEK